MIKRISSCLFFLLLPTLIIMGPILTGISPASAHDEEDMSQEDMSEEIEPPRLRKKDLQTKSRKSASSSKSSRKRYVKEDEEDNEEEEDDDDGDDEEEEDEEDQDEKEHTVLHRILWYVPNRLLDVADIARARIRVGPGVALNAHVTKVVQAGLGSYMSLYAGLPGPRQQRSPRLPIGVEAYSGGALSVAEASFETGYEPEYSPTEVGAGIHFILLGIDVGVDPLEIIDLVTGIVGVDIGKDDY